MKTRLAPFTESSCGRLRSVARGVAGLSVAVLTTSAAYAQGPPELTFSVDFAGPIVSVQGDAVGNPITDADLLVRRGGLFTPATPALLFRAQFLDRYTQCFTHSPGDNCGIEINAFSFGRDARLLLDPGYRFSVLFSVDEYAVGLQPGAGFPYSNVFSQAAAMEAAGDIFFTQLQGVPPFNQRPNAGYADGNGQGLQGGGPRLFGLGLTEPIPRTPGTPELGDNVDAIDYGSRYDNGTDNIYFSLEGGFAKCNEPASPVFNSATSQSLMGTAAPAQAADVLVFDSAALQVRPYVRAAELGLDLGGVGTDDIDGLVVVENGQIGYQPPMAFYDWQQAGGSDLILFSVRCGSALVGVPDPVTQVPISEGDVLIKLGTGPTPPRIFISAGTLGLRSIADGFQESDELNGLDIFDEDDEAYLDCNMNGIDDAIDITDMNSDDVDLNGVPDECEDEWAVLCDCDDPVLEAPCGNSGPVGRGCGNSAMTAGELVPSGTTSISSDALVLTVTDLPPAAPGIIVTGLGVTSTPVQNGTLCITSGGGQPLIRVALEISDATGSFSIGGLFAIYGTISPAPIVTAGSTWGFQAYYRDIGGPCMGFANFTNAISVLFTP